MNILNNRVAAILERPLLISEAYFSQTTKRNMFLKVLDKLWYQRLYTYLHINQHTPYYCQTIMIVIFGISSGGHLEFVENPPFWIKCVNKIVMWSFCQYHELLSSLRTIPSGIS